MAIGRKIHIERWRGEIILAFFISYFSLLWATNPTGTLPVVYINTTNNQAIDSKDVYVTGSLYIDPLSTGQTALGSASSPVTAQFKGRGNYTWTGFDKKPYRIKFDAKQKVLGMPNNKHWCLLAHADDNLGFLRMPAAFRISEALGLRWTPRYRAVELVINGSYKGLYFLTEHVRIAGNRVAITEQEDGATDSVSGGWLVEIDNYRTEGNIAFTEGNGQDVMVSLKEPEVLSAQQRDYIVAQMNMLNTDLYDMSSGLEQRLDMTEAAKYYLVQEIMEDCESYHGSCFLYKDRDRNGVVDKWKFGPVWDMGNAYMRHQEKWIYENPTWPQYWIGQLAQWPAFQQAVKEQWWIYYHTYKDQVRADIRAYADEIETAARKDGDVWRSTSNYSDNSNYDDVRDRFFRRYDWRINWLYQQWGEGTKPVTWDIEHAADERPQSRKILRDGQIVIEANGRVYNVLGQVVKD